MDGAGCRVDGPAGSNPPGATAVRVSVLSGVRRKSDAAEPVDSKRTYCCNDFSGVTPGEIKVTTKEICCSAARLLRETKQLIKIVFEIRVAKRYCLAAFWERSGKCQSA